MDSRISETAFNQARYPVLDRNGETECFGHGPHG